MPIALGQQPEGAKPADQESTAADTPATRPRPTEQARKTYLGRIVALPMGHQAAGWLIRDNREDQEKASVSFQKLKLSEGMTICDLGCGNGYWTLPMAMKIGATGRALAVDIQPEMLDKLKVRAAKFVGISVPMHTALRLGVRVAERIRKINSNCHICFYGLYAALNSEYLLD